jgi:putative GTP pyrophosphokinase
MELGPDHLRDYEARCSTLADLGPVAERLIKELLHAADIRVHSVRHRIKTKESLQRKVGRKDASYEGLADIHDLLGVRVITLFPDEVDRVANVIESEFSLDLENSVDKRTLDPDRFGYLSLHYVASLNNDRAQLTEHERFNGILFEIQIRSILQHVWAEIEHDLGYHVAGAIPGSFRRRFSRLAGLLEIADDEFQTLRNEITTYKEDLSEGIDKTPESVRIDQDSVTALLRTNSDLQELDSYIAKALGVRLVEGEFASAGNLALELQLVGIETVAEVSRLLREKSNHLRAFVDSWATGVSPSTDQIFPGVGLFYLCYVVLAGSGSVEQVVAYLEAANINITMPDTRESVALRVLETDAKAKEGTAASQWSES